MVHLGGRILSPHRLLQAASHIASHTTISRSSEILGASTWKSLSPGGRSRRCLVRRVAAERVNGCTIGEKSPSLKASRLLQKSPCLQLTTRLPRIEKVPFKKSLAPS